MNPSPYLDALSKIPKAETRSFAEIAALAGKPSAARAAGRAVSSCPAEAKIPWHRAVNAEGALSIDPERATVQLERLRAEGARPKDGETVVRWAKRRKVEIVGLWKGRRYAHRDDPIVANFSPLHVEAFQDESEAEARGFEPCTTRARASGPAPLRAVPASRPTSTAPHSASVAHQAASMAPQRGSPGVDRARATRNASDEDCDEEPRRNLALRLASFDWARARSLLPREGAFVAHSFFDPNECQELRDAFEDDARFERSIQMAPRGYGIGRYRYFTEPLPSPAFEVRARLYSELRELAAETPNTPQYPSTLPEFFEQCRAAGQARSSSILLRYEQGGVNHPHRDIYGSQWFPYQALVVLSERGRDFEGGEFQLHEKQADGSVYTQTFALGLGDLCVFASKCVRSGETTTRSRSSSPRWRDVEHGMSPVTRGERYALGIVFHLAE